MSKNVDQFCHLNYTMPLELYRVLIRVRNQKTAINNKVRTVEQTIVLDPVN